MPPPETNLEFEALLDYLKHNRGCDLTGYKRSTLMRRFEHRMQKISVDSYQNYLQYLQCGAEEHLALLQDVLINFTGFFRDPDAWVYLTSDIIPKIIANKRPKKPIRVWSAGCSTGQEICSFLILVSESLGIEFCLQHLQCYATDADEDALQKAQNAVYSDLDVISIHSELLERYFQKTEHGYVFHSDLHRLIDFKQHNLMQDAPILAIDLLICRNVLMYFTEEAQASILTHFHSAISNTGFLFLGQAEMLVHHRQFFTPVNLKQRFYSKELNLGFENSRLTDHRNNFWKTVFELSFVAQIILDHNGYLIDANQQAMLLFELTLSDLSCPFQDLKIGKLFPLNVLTKHSNQNYDITVLKNIEWVTPEGTQFFDIEIIPIFNAQTQHFNNSVIFLETTNCRQLTEKLEQSNSELKEISEESQDLKLELEAAQQEIKRLLQDQK